MTRTLIPQIFFLMATLCAAVAIQAPTGLVSRTGDQSIVLHWDRNSEISLSGYRVYRAGSSAGPFAALNSSLLTAPGFCDLNVINGQTNFYYVTAVDTNLVESVSSVTLALVAEPFASDDQFLEYLQQTSFDYFWYGANPINGLVPDRSAPGSYCSIAAVGFGLTAIGIGIDHGWISRTQGVTRVLTTLNTFLNGPQGTNTSGVIGYKGWFYHFLDRNTGLRATAELSSIDTALLLAGVLYAKQYFNGTNLDETMIRATADLLFNRVDWNWMAQGTDAVATGWLPTSGFQSFGNWIGYNEAMIIYCLGLGTTTNPLPASAWNRWTSGYIWTTNYGLAYVAWPPLFVYQYSHCWIDFRHIADAYMNAHNSTYFENSRRATLAQIQYCIANPKQEVGYNSNVWGLTACDGPNETFNGVTYQGYGARGAPNGLDDGTIAPTGAGGSLAFATGYALPTLRYFYSHFRRNIWTAYGFRDAFNLGAQWWDTDELGIDQGPIVLMIENYRNQRVWKLFMNNPEVQVGLQRAGFVPLPVVATSAQALPAQNSFTLTWPASAGRTYQVEFSPDLETWFASLVGPVTATGTTATWGDTGAPATSNPPFEDSERFYRVFQFGPP